MRPQNPSVVPVIVPGALSDDTHSTRTAFSAGLTTVILHSMSANPGNAHRLLPNIWLILPEFQQQTQIRQFRSSVCSMHSPNPGSRSCPCPRLQIDSFVRLDETSPHATTGRPRNDPSHQARRAKFSICSRVCNYGSFA